MRSLRESAGNPHTHVRADDYVGISLDSEYRYNPVHNDLDAYAPAYNIVSLLNNLLGRPTQKRRFLADASAHA
jgi:hypothetical protein